MNIPGFQILEKLGEGSIAEVWKAHQLSLDRTVAIKVLKPEFTYNPSEVNAFIREARSAAKLKHVNIIQVYDVAEQDGVYYIVMEYVAGSTLGRMLRKQGAISEKKALKIVRDVADALDSAWEKEAIIHRNVTPENIMVDENGAVKIADLGLVKKPDSSKLSAQLQAGIFGAHLNYISPEQAIGTSQLDCRTDMYSLGATLYHMLTGEMPFSGAGASDLLNKHMTGILPSPRDIEPSVSLGASRLLARLMMKDPKNRYRNWGEALDDIKKVIAGRPIVLRQGPGLMSSVEPPKTATPAAGTGPIEGYVPRPRAPAAPSWVSTLFWLVMVTFWIYLIYTLLRLPPVKGQGGAAPPERAAVASTQPAKPTLHVSGGPGPDYQPGGLKTPDKTNGQPAGARPAPKPAEPPENPDLAEVKTSLAAPLLSEKFDDAIALIDKKLEDEEEDSPLTGELNNLKKFIREISKMNTLLADAFVDKRGQEVSIRIGNKNRRVVIRAIVGDTVDAKIAGDSEDSVRFSMKGLDPVEKSSWLGKPNTQAKCAMKCILLMQGKQYETAKALAGNAGPLSRVFTKEADRRMSGGSAKPEEEAAPPKGEAKNGAE